MEKDETIIELLNWLREQIGDKFVITDDWDADLCAVGISRPDDAAQLAYISSWQRPDGYYFIELETSPVDDRPYQVVATFESVSRNELLRIVCKHLGISD